MRPYKYLLAAVLVALTGCSTPTKTIVAQLAVQRVTYEVVKDNPERADRVVEIVKEVEEVAGTEGANTVPLLITLVRNSIRWEKLSDPDKQTVNTLLELLAAELQVQFDKLPVDAEKWLAVKTVARWVRETAELYDTKTE